MLTGTAYRRMYNFLDFSALNFKNIALNYIFLAPTQQCQNDKLFTDIHIGEFLVLG